MMTDLVQRLRDEVIRIKAQPSPWRAPHRHELLTEAADAIEWWHESYKRVLGQSQTRSRAINRLEQEIQELREQPKIKRLEIADLRPDDIVIANVQSDSELTDRDLASIRETLQGEFPGHQVIVLFNIELRLVRPGVDE